MRPFKMIGSSPERADEMAPKRNSPVGWSLVAIDLRSRTCLRTILACQNRNAGFRRGNSPAGPGQQGDADLGFESADALRDCSWRQIESPRRFGNRSLFDHRKESFKKTGIHANKMYRLKKVLSTLSLATPGS
jgi:hypothetical protein